MLGTPVALTTLLMADTSIGSVCDDSIPPVKLDLELLSCALLHENTEHSFIPSSLRLQPFSGIANTLIAFIPIDG